MDLAEEDGFSRPDYQLHLFLEDFQLSLLFAIYIAVKLRIAKRLLRVREN